MRVIRANSTLAVAMLILAFLAFGATPGNCQDKPKCFVDFDGDGINDNIDDSDGDGIPNNADPDFIVKAIETQVDNAMDFGSTISEMGLSADVASNSDKFGANEFCARSLSSNRCGFTSEEGFGGEGLGVDVGGGGGACAGGVCR